MCQRNFTNINLIHVAIVSKRPYIILMHIYVFIARVACYYQSWAVYRPSKGYFQISDIDASLCTHHIYAFASINSDAEVLVEDSYADLDLGKFK